MVHDSLSDPDVLNVVPLEQDDKCVKKVNLQCQLSIKAVKTAFKTLEGVQVWFDKVIAAGFGAFWKTNIDSSINKNCMSYCMMKINPVTMKMTFGHDKVIEVNRYNIHKLTGLPNGNLTAPRPSMAGNVNAFKKLRAELGLDQKEELNIQILQKLLNKLVTAELLTHDHDPHREKLALKVFFLIFFNRIICVGSSYRITREPNMVDGLDFEQMQHMDYCQIVVDEIQRSAESWQTGERTEWSYLEGFSLGPMLMYLDSLIYNHNEDMTTHTPRLECLLKEKLKKIANADCIVKDDGIVFGNIKVSSHSSDKCMDVYAFFVCL